MRMMDELSKASETRTTDVLYTMVLRLFYIVIIILMCYIDEMYTLILMLNTSPATVTRSFDNDFD